MILMALQDQQELLLNTTPFYREIVDESDVYIDVPKSIKRRAPAPRVFEAKKNVKAAKEAQNIVAQDLPVPQRHRLRRVSTAPIGNRSCADTISPEQRRHLDNLAPSNLATSPKQTRFANVKIKSVGGGARRASSGGPGSADQKGKGTKDSGAVNESTPLLDS